MWSSSRWAGFCFILVWLMAPSTGAWGEGAEVTEKSVKGRELVIAIQGEVMGEEILALSVEPGPSAHHAIRIYSEPSHTLLALILDKDFETSSVGQAWMNSELLHEKPIAQVITKLPEGQPRLHIQGRPKLDDRIVAHVYGRWPDGAEEERLIADTLVGTGDFGFSSYVRFE